MGSNWSHFKKALESGDENRCLILYHKHAELRRRLADIAIHNLSTNDTFMHVCAQRGMARFLKLLLEDPKANPNTLNRYGQNVLHLCCDVPDDVRQHECLKVCFK